MRCRVTESYSIDLPPGVRKEIDSQDTVTSYWFEGKEFFLQLSSYKRTGPQAMQASQRLYDYLASEGTEKSTPVALLVHAPDFAAVTYADEQNQKWLIAFLIWSDLMIFATIMSGDSTQSVIDSWATRAIESIERVSDD